MCLTTLGVHHLHLLHLAESSHGLLIVCIVTVVVMAAIVVLLVALNARSRTKVHQPVAGQAAVVTEATSLQLAKSTTTITMSEVNIILSA